jgi:hypothetical protein
MRTETTKQELTRADALKRARAEHLVITGTGESASLRTVFVAHPEDPTGGYVVRWELGARVLTCSCEAGRHGVACKHRVLAHEFWTTAARTLARMNAGQDRHLASGAVMEFFGAKANAKLEVLLDRGTDTAE